MTTKVSEQMSKPGALTTRSSNTILAAADHGKLFLASSTFTQTLTAAATLGSGWRCYYRNVSTGKITLDPNSSETINGATTIVLYPGESCEIVCDGSNFYAFGLSTGDVLMQSQIASGVAQIDFTDVTGFSAYRLVITGWQPATDGATVLLRMSTNNGVSYDSGNNYTWVYQYNIDGTGAGVGSSSSANAVYATGGMDSAVDLGTAIIDMPAMGNSLKPVMYRNFGRINTGAQFTLYGGGLYSNASTANAIRLTTDGGNITGGVFKLYGINRT